MDNLLDNKNDEQKKLVTKKVTNNKSKSATKKRKIVRKKKNKGISFKKFLAYYSIALALIGVFFLILLFFFLKDYEKSIPTNEMDKILADMKTSKLESIIEEANIEYNEFENGELISSKLQTIIENNELTYSKKLGEYSATNPVYKVSAGDSDICTIRLKKETKKTGFFKNWDLEDISFNALVDSEELVVTVPSNSSLYLNDILVPDSYKTSSAVTFEPCLNVSKYVDTPTEDIYTITGLNIMPEIRIEYDGNQLEYEQTDNNIVAYYPSVDSMYDEASTKAMEVLECYGKYIINRGSLETLSSYMVGTAREYVANIPAVWAFLVGRKFSYEFRDMSTSNFRVYSKDCYSIDVSCVLYVNWGDGEKSYETSYRYTFVKVKGNWKVADLSVL